jgi:ferritin
MVFGNEVLSVLNKQLTAEFESAYLYLAMSNSCMLGNLPGAANWLRVQAQEELTHAMKLYDFMQSRDGDVTLGSVDAPPRRWDSALKTFQAALEHERKMSAALSTLVDLALKSKDHATNNLLQWFIAEQVEEEATVTNIIHQLKLIGDNTAGLYMIDRELAMRVFTPAPDPKDAAA